MTMTRFTAALTLLTAATACTAGGVVAPRSAAPSIATTAVVNSLPQVPLLYVVDGVKYPRDQVPALSRDQIVAVKVIKGHAALRQYGPDASYGVVVIKTRQFAAAPKS